VETEESQRRQRNRPLRARSYIRSNKRMRRYEQSSAVRRSSLTELLAAEHPFKGKRTCFSRRAAPRRALHRAERARRVRNEGNAEPSYLRKHVCRSVYPLPAVPLFLFPSLPFFRLIKGRSQPRDARGPRNRLRFVLLITTITPGKKARPVGSPWIPPKAIKGGALAIVGSTRGASARP